jgi:hypothetical protein
VPCELVHTALARLSAIIVVRGPIIGGARATSTQRGPSVAGILTTVMASPSKEVAINGDFRNFVRVDGLHVALPTDMTSFPAMLVAQP